MGVVIADIETVGGGSEGVRIFLQISIVGVVAVRGRDLGAYY